MTQNEIVDLAHNMILNSSNTFQINDNHFVMEIQPNQFNSEDFYIQSKLYPFTDNPIPPFIQFKQIDKFSFKLIQCINENNKFSVVKEFDGLSKLDIRFCLIAFFREAKNA